MVAIEKRIWSSGLQRSRNGFDVQLMMRLVGLAVSSLLILACSAEPKRFEYHAIIAGGPDGWPIWAEELAVDEGFLPGGVNSSGYDLTPPVGGSRVVREPAPAPRVVEGRWFSYRAQKFYLVKFELPDDMEAKLRQWYDEYPTSEYTHYLLLGFSGKGEALAWWRAKCSVCGLDRSRDFSTPLVDDIRAEEVSGDTDKYRLQTQEFIDEGRIPASVLD